MEQQINTKYFFVINPNAGNEGGNLEWPKIVNMLKTNSIEYDFAFTEHVGHAEEIVSQKILESYRKFIVVGGDGTVNEVTNGIFKQKAVPTLEIYLGLIQMGTGNDWARYYDMKPDYKEEMERLVNCPSRVQDVGKIKYSSDGEQKSAYFINIAGLCFDSTVVKATNEMKQRGRRTKFAYLISLLKSLIKYKPWHLKIYINDEILEGQFLSISIGNGKYSGGGMIQTPDAIIDDGYLHVTIYQNMPKHKIITKVHKLYNSTILEIKGIKSFKTKGFKIESKEPIFAETDGEIIGSTPYEISILPSSLNVIV
ncbi:MAG: diacylglycerol kinase family lipid kinase [Bacteroidales bacterium]|nr:diacylglycerol kinase family lipid kinase [Bacteroidales bacterium]MDD4217091.1 diacylglycerol kinase family lipid kinase [Bacteroidales bacterium]MDY0142142.1 diacylglycerol kinase family lipid kinase [Bacteroidales bacterium]